ncbi:hypothetical protein BDA99DRAFT_537545 [Phascolomyces articulosus]|uniref:Uncharacterized protein n=1 Tax=Phascolomyces articulosus TaxID=60185 RepID=A0AAD5K976_9FUNG|nr:hypothetical protein BDA99DRAFT_537545 [Phascolomyces articulosus]
MVFPVLGVVPQLEPLTLLVDDLVITIADLEEMHDLCSKLQHLECSPKTRLEGGLHDLAPETIQLMMEPINTMKTLILPNTLWHEADICAKPYWAYITTKYPMIDTLQSYISIDDLSNPLPPREEERMCSMELKKDYFPHLEQVKLGPFAGRVATTWPLLVKDVIKVSLFRNATPGFLDWIHHTSTNRVQQLSFPVIPKAIDQLSHCSQLTELNIVLLHGDGSLHQEPPLDVVFSACTLLRKLVATGCIILCDDERHQGQYIDIDGDDDAMEMTSGNTKSTVNSSPLQSLVSLKTLILHNSIFKDSRILIRIGDRCPQLTHIELASCLWSISDLDIKHSAIRIEMPSHYFSYFNISSPSVCTYASGEDGNPSIFLELVDRGQEHRQPRHGYISQYREDVYFMIKRMNEIKSHEVSQNLANKSLALFKVERYRVGLVKLVIRRFMHSNNIAKILDKEEDVLNEEATLQAMKKVLDNRGYAQRCHTRYCGVVLYCRGVDLLYHSNIRLDLGDVKFCRKI